MIIQLTGNGTSWLVGVAVSNTIPEAHELVCIVGAGGILWEEFDSETINKIVWLEFLEKFYYNLTSF